MWAPLRLVKSLIRPGKLDSPSDFKWAWDRWDRWDNFRTRTTGASCKSIAIMIYSLESVSFRELQVIRGWDEGVPWHLQFLCLSLWLCDLMLTWRSPKFSEVMQMSLGEKARLDITSDFACPFTPNAE